jgi:PhnB protein
MTSAIPGNYRRITPCLVVRGSVRALEFYTALFGAKVRMNFPAPDGTIAHAEMEIGDSVVIVEEENPHRGTQAPPADGLSGTPVFQFIYVEDVDEVVRKAAELGWKVIREPETQFYGDRDSYVIDPFGHGWVIASHVEDVSDDELGRRLARMYG